MNTILTDADEVKFKSFCPKHSGLDWNEEEGDDDRPVKVLTSEDRRRNRGADISSSSQPRLAQNTEETRLSERKLRVQQLEDEFYRFVAADEVAEHLQLPLEMVDFLLQYWKLKRKVNFNQPLIMPKKEEEDSLARREQEVLLRRLRLFTHLRQDLERVRFAEPHYHLQNGLRSVWEKRAAANHSSGQLDSRIQSLPSWFQMNC